MRQLSDWGRQCAGCAPSILDRADVLGQGLAISEADHPSCPLLKIACTFLTAPRALSAQPGRGPCEAIRARFPWCTWRPSAWPAGWRATPRGQPARWWCSRATGHLLRVGTVRATPSVLVSLLHRRPLSFSIEAITALTQGARCESSVPHVTSHAQRHAGHTPAVVLGFST